ncbi:MAG: RNase adapter RapZ [Desulfobacterota bacterium]|nr:RNase adapter RapZ [Thermodesulfobacteriota bacterium]MDW8001942.1 RNase adapter RapZ [Deltaproteobacteria bacterium]
MANDGLRVVIVTGTSGSGKTTFLRALEDLGYFCVDNFPVVMLDRFLELFSLSDKKERRCALVIDVREKEFFLEGQDIVRSAKEKYNAEIVFLDSSDEVLIRRFSQTRRAHPLSYKGSVKAAIEEERKLLKWIKDLSDRIIDTSSMSARELKNLVFKNYSVLGKGMKVNLISFGYSYGVPLEADLLIDVRFLPNPNYVEELKSKTGLDDEVRSYILQSEIYGIFSEMLWNLLSFLLPQYEKEGKSYLTIGFGCTGGRHRSVCVATDFSERCSNMGYNVTVIHRDIGR